MDKKADKNRIDKLIAFFKTLKQSKPGPKPGPVQADYTSWDQTEEEYQQEQARWMESVNRKKSKKNTDEQNADE